LGYAGNIGGAWRGLDKNLRGWVCLEDMDQASAAIVESFKEWAETSFGSVQRAFQAMDTDNGGSLTLTELKIACRRLKWSGSPKVLFESMAYGGRHLTMKDLAFLNTWVCKNPANMEAHTKVMDSLWQELFDAPRAGKLPARSWSAGSRSRKRLVATNSAPTLAEQGLPPRSSTAPAGTSVERSPWFTSPPGTPSDQFRPGTPSGRQDPLQAAGPPQEEFPAAPGAAPAPAPVPAAAVAIVAPAAIETRLPAQAMPPRDPSPYAEWVGPRPQSRANSAGHIGGTRLEHARGLRRCMSGGRQSPPAARFGGPPRRDVDAARRGGVGLRRR